MSHEVANSFPINCGQGLVYLEKLAQDTSSSESKSEDEFFQTEEKSDEMAGVEPLVYFIMPRYGKNLE